MLTHYFCYCDGQHLLHVIMTCEFFLHFVIDRFGNTNVCVYNNKVDAGLTVVITGLTTWQKHNHHSAILLLRPVLLMYM